MKRNILITGGAGFIGSHVVRLFVGKSPDCRIVNLDRLTYAGNLANLRDVENRPNYTFVKGDICDYDAMRSLFAEYDIDGVIHLAAESHVDRSIRDPFTFARTNVMGTLTLLQAAREHWNGAWEGRRFHHISTDEVYGALPFDGTLFTEQTRYDPLALLGVESLVGPFRTGVPRHVRIPGRGDELFEQLRALSVSRETDPAVYQ